VVEVPVDPDEPLADRLELMEPGRVLPGLAVQPVPRRRDDDPERRVRLGGQRLGPYSQDGVLCRAHCRFSFGALSAKWRVDA
jgi:hypothetical protein